MNTCPRCQTEQETVADLIGTITCSCCTYRFTPSKVVDAQSSIPVPRAVQIARKNTTSTSVFGIGGLLLGLLLLGFFLFSYDTSVWSEGIPAFHSQHNPIFDIPAIPSRRVENIGKLNFRLCGIIGACALMVVGAIFLATGKAPKPLDICNSGKTKPLIEVRQARQKNREAERKNVILIGGLIFLVALIIWAWVSGENESRKAKKLRDYKAETERMVKKLGRMIGDP
jgi:hypothetical protein